MRIRATLFRRLSENRLRRGGQSPFVAKTPQKGTVPGGFRIASKVLLIGGAALIPSVLALWNAAADEGAPKPADKPAAVDSPGTLTSIAFDLGDAGDRLTLAGRDSRRQLLVTGTYSTGQVRDLTRGISYSVEPATIAKVDGAGLILPLAEGEATITAKDASGPSATVKLGVSHLVSDLPINFPNQIVPVFTKLSCNSGGCHGKASGQNGFRLSLLGFEPSEDYDHLVKEGRGRRLFPAAPERSLLLMKATGQVPHGGGQRMEKDSIPYRLIYRWIEQGLPFGKPEDPKVSQIEVLPTMRTLPPKGQQQLVCIAHYTDGSTEDVTSMTQFEPNDTEMAEVTPTGLVKARDLSGTVAVMARYQGQVAVFRASLPLGAVVKDLPAPKNFIDELVFQQLTTLGVPPSVNCDDSTFLRRTSLDIAGRLPTAEETEKFLADPDPAKREKWIDRLLESEAYADYFANKWSSILRNKRQQESFAHGTYLFHDWIRQSLYENKPYDQFVRDILTASGEMGENPPVAWYRSVRETNQQMEDTAQLFLGLRIQCARCHHHPFEKWSQQDYYGFEAFFSRVGRKKGMQVGEERIFHQRGVATAVNPRSGQTVKPAGLGAKTLDLSADQDPRQALVDWMADSKNPFFARALANRYWKHFLGRGLVEPEDDMRVTNPATNPALLDALANDFAESKFDLKHLIRTICNSRVYQLSAEPNQFNAGDKQSYSRYYPKRLEAESLLDAIDQVTGVDEKFNGLPAGTRAMQLPDTGFNSYFLTVFGRPEGASACECERSNEANLAQSLHLLNSAEVQNKLSAASGRAAALAADQQHTHAQKIERLYLQFYSRRPAPEETALAVAHIAKTKNDKAAYEDIVWALINTKEFLFNH
ncbi:MAG TPA: DUF1549 and DUF1553 domain-containing protein [Pirellulales bacterium]|nr:DUF1549 and DUF1553 domain-containing protein [Pirellulales bacterium]